MQKSDQELPPGRQHTGHLGLHLVSSHPSLGLGTDKEEPAGLGGDTGLSIPLQSSQPCPLGHLCPFHLPKTRLTLG